MWAWLRSFWRKQPRWDIVLYTRSGCHLCDEAWTLLDAARRRSGGTLTTVDVDSDAELAARYGLEVPVVAINGKVRFRGGVNAVLLRRLLDRSTR